jgi:hypothetical protein
MLSKQEEQIERVGVMRNDARVREQQGSTFHQFAEADAQIPGRFSAVASSYVIGSKSDISGAYPAAAAAHQIQLPDEPPLGLDNPALEPSSCEAQATGPTSGAPSTPDVLHDVGPLSSQPDATPSYACVEQRGAGFRRRV